MSTQRLVSAPELRRAPLSILIVDDHSVVREGVRRRVARPPVAGERVHDDRRQVAIQSGRQGADRTRGLVRDADEGRGEPEAVNVVRRLAGQRAAGVYWPVRRLRVRSSPASTFSTVRHWIASQLA